MRGREDNGEKDGTGDLRTLPPSTSPLTALVVAAALVAIVGFFVLRADAEADSVERAVPGLVERLARSTWAPVAWDDPDDVKAAVRAGELDRIDRDVPRTWASSVADEQRSTQLLTLERALAFPQMIVVEQRVEVLGIDGIDVDGDTATVDVEWRTDLRARPHPIDPRQIGWWEVDEDGWRVAGSSQPELDRFTLVREGGEWKIRSRYSLVPGHGT